MAQEAVGLIETKGFCAMLEAADSALKAANVTMTGYEAVGSGYVCAFFRGDVAAVKAAIDAAAEAASKVGEVVAVRSAAACGPKSPAVPIRTLPLAFAPPRR